MKRILFTSMIIASSLAANAQHIQSTGHHTNKAEHNRTYAMRPAINDDNSDGKWTMELQFNPFSNNYSTFSMAGVKARYFWDKKHALRLNLGLNIDGNTQTANDFYDDPKSNDKIIDNTTTTKSHSTAFTLGLGYERHYNVASRLDLYAGFELGYKGLFYSANVKSDNYNEYYYEYYKTRTKIQENDERNYKKCDNNGNTNRNSLFANVLLGADYFITRNIYIGAEMGVGFDYGKGVVGYYTDNNIHEVNSNSEGKISTTKTTTTYSSKTGYTTTVTKENGKTTTTNECQEMHTTSNSTFGFKFYADPALRIGVRF